MDLRTTRGDRVRLIDDARHTKSQSGDGRRFASRRRSGSWRLIDRPRRKMRSLAVVDVSAQRTEFEAHAISLRDDTLALEILERSVDALHIATEISPSSIVVTAWDLRESQQFASLDTVNAILDATWPGHFDRAKPLFSHTEREDLRVCGRIAGAGEYGACHGLLGMGLERDDGANAVSIDLPV